MHSEKFKENRFDSVEFAPPKNLAPQQRVLIEQRKQAAKEYYRTGNRRVSSIRALGRRHEVKPTIHPYFALPIVYSEFDAKLPIA